MTDHGRKMIAPILITVLVVIYEFVYFGVLISLVKNTALKLLLFLVPAVLAAAMIGVLVQRIKEIKGGEEDDLGQY